MNKLLSQIRAAVFGYTDQLGVAPRCNVSRNQAEPSRKIAPLAKSLPVADSHHTCGRDGWPNAGDFHQPALTLMRAGDRFDRAQLGSHAASIRGVGSSL